MEARVPIRPDQSDREILNVPVPVTAIAMVKFFQKHDKYPTTLEQLVPEFIEKIPATHKPIWLRHA